MNAIRRLLLSSIIAFLVAGMITAVAQAGGPYYRSQENIYRLTGSGTTTRITNAGCYKDNNTGTKYCRYMTQDNSYPTAYAWNMSASNIYYWHAYIPSIGEAAAKYRVKETGSYYWDVVVNQASATNKGKIVWLGFSDIIPNSGEYVFTSNACVSGYYCGALKVYWDDIEYTTNPTTHTTSPHSPHY
jgi:hypothetical protein